MKVIVTESQYNRVLLEQELSIMDRLKRKWKRVNQNLNLIEDFIYEYRHGLLDVAAIGTMFIPLVGPFISLGIELGNAALYANEGDDYTAGLSLAFTLIPAGQLIRRIPAIKNMTKGGLRSLMKKVSNPETAKTLSKTEKELMEQVNKQSKWIRLTATKELTKKITIGLLKKLNLPKIVNLFYYFGLKYPKTFAVTKFGLQLGGIWYSYDKLAGIYGLKNKDEKDIEKQKKLNSEFDLNKDEHIKGIMKEVEKNINTEEQNKQYQEYVAKHKIL
jgi:hypothetical protein